MIYLYIFGSIALFIILCILFGRWVKRENYKEWLLEINQWEIGDTVEIGEDKLNSTYYCVDDNMKHQQFAYWKAAIEQYEKKYGKKEAYVKLLKWDANDALIELPGGNQIHMATNFISKNISFIRRKLDKNMDTFVLTKTQKLQKLRRNKLIRVLEENGENEK